MQKYLKTLGMTVVAATIMGTAAMAQAEKLRIAGNFASDHSSSLAMKIFKEIGRAHV